MKSYWELCEDCDRLQEYPDTCYKFLIEGYGGIFGRLIEPTVQNITWSPNWEVDHEQRTVKLLGDTFETRTARMNELLLAEKNNQTFKVLKKWSSEQISVFGFNQEVVLTMERVAAPLFGVVSHAVQLIVYTEDDSGIKIWAARRAPTKWLYPNKLGVTVAGGLPAGETPFECVVREAAEEASLPKDLVQSFIRSAGIVNYATTTDSKTTSGGEEGLIRAEQQFLYEMKVGNDVLPTPFDKEASDISLYTIDEIKTALDAGEFTPGNACYILAFLIRHGLVTFENEPNYAKIIRRLHRSLDMHTA